MSNPENPTPSEVDPQVFGQTLHSVSSLINELGAEPLTLREARDNGFLDYVATADQDLELPVGKKASISGEADDVSYNLNFLMFGEAAGISTENPEAAIFMLNASEAGYDASSGGKESAGKGALIGSVIMSKDYRVAADFDHGTQRSDSPDAQAILARITGFYGFEEDEVFGENARLTFLYSNQRLDKLTAGLDSLAQQREV